MYAKGSGGGWQHRTMFDGALALETRRRIYRYITEFPGAYLRQIQKTLDMSMGHLEYHLEYMEKENLIVARMKGKRKRYFPVKHVSYLEQKMLSLLHQKIPRGIVLFLMMHPYARHKDMLKELTCAPSTLSSNLKRLVNSEMIRCINRGKEKEYRVIDEAAIIRLLILYGESFKDMGVGQFVDRWAGSVRRFSRILGEP